MKTPIADGVAALPRTPSAIGVTLAALRPEPNHLSSGGFVLADTGVEANCHFVDLCHEMHDAIVETARFVLNSAASPQ